MIISAKAVVECINPLPLSFFVELDIRIESSKVYTSSFGPGLFIKERIAKSYYPHIKIGTKLGIRFNTTTSTCVQIFHAIEGGRS